MIARIRHIKHRVYKRQALRLPKRRSNKWTITRSGCATADDRHEIAVEVGDHQAMMRGISDEEPGRRRIDEDFTGVAQRQSTRLSLLLRRLVAVPHATCLYGGARQWSLQ